MSVPRFVADPPGQRRTVALGSLTALYHRRSGQTHVVSEPAPEILAALSEGPLTAEALLARLREIADEVKGPEALEARLAELVAIGLVEEA